MVQSVLGLVLGLLLVLPLELGAQTFAKPATLLSDGRIQAVVQMPDGTLQTFTAQSGIDLAIQVKNYTTKQATAVNDIKAFTAGAPVPAVPAPDVVTPPADPPPTVPTAMQVFFSDAAQLCRVSSTLKVLGIDPISVKAYQDLLAKVTGEFLPAYVGVAGWPICGPF